MTENQKLKKYLQIHKKNPRSKVFVWLSELYRKRGDKEKALKLCQKGLEYHPDLSIGHIAQALVLLDMDKIERASQALEKATQLSPENILAYKLLGQCYLKLKKPLKTLSAYKMLLFLDPNNKLAQNIVKKLEPITAGQYDETGFAFKSLKDIAKHIKKQRAEEKKSIFPSLYPLSSKEDEQFKARLSIVSALIYRKEFKKAESFLLEMKNLYPKQAKSLKKWENLLPQKPPLDTKSQSLWDLSSTGSLKTDSTKSSLRESSHHLTTRQQKIKKLRHYLSLIEEKASNRP